MADALPGMQYCKAHQGNHSHYAEENCELCILDKKLAEAKADADEQRRVADKLRPEVATLRAEVKTLRDVRESFKREIDEQRACIAGLRAERDAARAATTNTAKATTADLCRRVALAETKAQLYAHLLTDAGDLMQSFASVWAERPLSPAEMMVVAQLTALCDTILVVRRAL